VEIYLAPRSLRSLAQLLLLVHLDVSPLSSQIISLVERIQNLAPDRRWLLAEKGPVVV
jgi:hypothetical protein